MFSLFNIYLSYLFNLDDLLILLSHIKGVVCEVLNLFSYFHGASLLLTFVIRFSCVMNLRFNEFIYYFNCEKVHLGRLYVFGE